LLAIFTDTHQHGKLAARMKTSKAFKLYRGRRKIRMRGNPVSADSEGFSPKTLLGATEFHFDQTRPPMSKAIRGLGFGQSGFSTRRGLCPTTFPPSRLLAEVDTAEPVPERVPRANLDMLLLFVTISAT
jgi:hypothetical protein